MLSRPMDDEPPAKCSPMRSLPRFLCILGPLHPRRPQNLASPRPERGQRLEVKPSCLAPTPHWATKNERFRVWAWGVRRLGSSARTQHAEQQQRDGPAQLAALAAFRTQGTNTDGGEPRYYPKPPTAFQTSWARLPYPESPKHLCLGRSGIRCARLRSRCVDHRRSNCRVARKVGP